MLHRLAKNGHASRARASGVFHFLPSPFTFTPYILIYNKLQVKAKTVFAFTPCDLPFLTRRGREKNERKRGKGVDFDQKRANLRAKTHNNPSDSRTAVKAKVNTDLHLFLHRINLIYCTLRKKVKGEGKKRKIAVCARAPAREEMYVSTTPDSLSRNASAPGHHFPTQADDLPRFAYDDEAGQSVIGSHGHWGTCASGQVGGRHLSDQEQPFGTHSGDNKGKARGKGAR